MKNVISIKELVTNLTCIKSKEGKLNQHDGNTAPEYNQHVLQM